MSFLKFSLFLVLPFNVWAAFSDMDCINSNFNTTVSHKAWPFGLTENILTIEKKQCLFTISHEKLKFFKNRWSIDVCRGPVHTKKGTTTVDVLKRDHDCSKETSSNFCKSLIKIESIIQDDGLIFAKGEKENITSDHGRMYCSFLLLKKYLRSGIIINRGQSYNGFLSPSPSATTPASNSGQFTDSSELHSF